MKYVFVLFCVMYAWYFVSRIVAALTDKSWSHESISIILSTAFQFVLFLQWMGVMISTAGVNYKVSGIVQQDRFKVKEIDLQRPGLDKLKSSSTDGIKLLQIQPQKGTMQLDPFMESTGLHLEQVLANPVGFEKFMTHLSYELSMQNLLGLIEFLQFQKHVVTDIGYYEVDDEKTERRKKRDLLCDTWFFSRYGTRFCNCK